ncbi:carboxypeptidase [Achlya hypogyna]|uniref:Carboxypeptidase n=1 Tax=Achlya hypogyna TaxID=1202772 RepID=A0A0A7CPB0_ACHHY|nr:secreted protein [Achlya hypogyna]OQR84419.1 carboxypeptidase [Achlya hypogyna]
MHVALYLAAALAVFSMADAALVRGEDGRLRTAEAVATLMGDADTNRKCHTQNGDYLSSLTAGKYASSSFHKCFRTDAQIFEFLDALATQNANVVTKFQISTTYKGLPIWAYKISTGTRSKALYTQSLQHAREWIAGSSVVYTIASVLDDIAAKKPSPADTYDLVFVPIVNVDGYRITWSTKRLQRKNAHEVDLNRNWLTPIANPRPPPPSDETYPGVAYFSEKETQGLRDYIFAQQSTLAGFLDVHSFAGEVQLPYGDTKTPIGNGLDAKYKTLGDALSSAMGAYTTTLEWQMYLSYGCFEDWGQRYLNKPTLTIEMAGSDFTAPASSIVTSGQELYRGFYAFAKGVAKF